ncbi:MAG: hypothetical protein WKF46_08965, partial [Candidatus Limnocylindrales bacterium]
YATSGDIPMAAVVHHVPRATTALGSLEQRLLSVEIRHSEGASRIPMPHGHHLLTYYRPGP